MIQVWPYEGFGRRESCSCFDRVAYNAYLTLHVLAYGYNYNYNCIIIPCLRRGTAQTTNPNNAKFEAPLTVCVSQLLWCPFSDDCNHSY